MRRSIVMSWALAALWLGLSAGAAQAQVLIWSLPEKDGAWVRFEGTYRQTQARPESNAGDEALAWRSELTISSVGKTKAAFEGDEVPCRWVEFKTITKVDDLEKQPGPGGTYVYKVLIPEKFVIGKPVDDEGLPVTFIPIVKGYRKVSGREVESVSERVLAVYPTIAPVTYYANLEVDASAPKQERLPVAIDAIPVRVMKGSRVLEGSQTRSTNTAVLTLSEAVPFGLARFRVEQSREERGLTRATEQFRRKSLIEVEMTAVKAGTDAKSELPSSN